MLYTRLPVLRAIRLIVLLPFERRGRIAGEPGRWGDLVSVTGGTSGNNTFTYDADGNLLLQKEPGKTTLYLPGQQLTLNTGTGVINGNRYYDLPGGGSCVRSGSGTAYTFVIADHQGTPSLYLDNTAQNPTWRQYTPYGAPRGAAATAPDNHGFLNKPMSPTGLTIVGARAYDPAIGKFTSVDPVQDAQQPQQWNAYSYANNTPVTSSDPTGLIPEDCLHFDCYGYDPRPLKKGDGRGAGGCHGGCGTKKNIEWGKKHHKSSTKAKPGGKYVPPKRKTPRTKSSFGFGPGLDPGAGLSQVCVFNRCVGWQSGGCCLDCTLMEAGRRLEPLFDGMRAAHRYGQINGSACFMFCVGISYQDGYISFLVGMGVGLGASGTAGFVTARPSEQSPKGWMGCFGDGPGGCYTGGVKSGGRDANGHAKTYHGLSAGVGMSLWVGVTYNIAGKQIGGDGGWWMPPMDED